jgi:hypothetical protein
MSRRPVPTRAVRCTKAEPQPCAAAKLGNQGSNLDSSGSGPDVLPDYTIPHRILDLRNCVRRQRIELCSPD